MAKKNKQESAAVDNAKKRAKKEKEKKDLQDNKIQNVFGHPVRNMIITAVVSILLGVAFIIKPYEVSQYCGYGVGGLIAVVGIVYIILYFCHKPISGEYRSEFAIGLLALFAGAYVALSGIVFGGSGVGYVLAVRIIGILLIGDGLLKLQYSVDIGRMKFKQWWIVLIFAVLGLGVGVVTSTDFSPTAVGSSSVPVSFLYTMGGNIGLVSDKGQYNSFYSGMMMLGIGFCLNGVLDLLSMMIIAIRNHKARRDEAIAAGTAMVAAAQREELDERLPAESVYDEAPAAQEEFVFVPESAPAPVPAAPAPAPAAPVAAASAEPVVIPDPPQATPVEPME